MAPKDGETPQVPSYIMNCARLERSEMVNKDGLRLATYSWKASNETTRQGVIYVVHGVSSHICYDYLLHTRFEAGKGYENGQFFSPQYEDSWVEAFNKQGFDVMGIDLQSYGLSEGKKGLRNFFEKFEDLVDDLIQFRKVITEQNPNESIYVLGNSMGGCLGVRLVEKDTEFKYEGLITLAPMMSLEQLKKKAINRILFPLSGFASKWIPTVRLAEKEKHVNHDMHVHFISDPLNEGWKVRCRVGDECLKAVDTAREHVQSIACPTLIIHSTFDTMCDHAGSEFLFANIGSTDKELDMISTEENLWHAIHQEPGNEKILERIVTWLNNHAKTTVTIE